MSNQYPRHIGRLPDPGPDTPLVLTVKIDPYAEILIEDRIWLVHRSLAGALEFLCRALGEGNIEWQEDISLLVKVPKDKKGYWVGAQGRVVGFLRSMFGVQTCRIIGNPEWRRR